MDRENEPQQMSWLVCCNSPLVHPTSPVPLVILPLQILRQARLSHPHPFGKGRGGYGCILACEGVVAMEVEPTSLDRGEGLVSGLTGEIGGGLDGGSGGRRREDERTSTVMGLMLYSNSAFRTKIAYDINTGWLDN